MSAYYNENDKFAAAWLRELIKANLVADGEVDERSITDVRADDLSGFTQCHFFAGIGGWSYALRLAGWPDDREVWTGSCPCQPASNCGHLRGEKDERHLWPVWFPLIEQCRPSTVFGEQVASAAGLQWFDLVSDDMEGKAYAVAAADLCAPCVGSADIRQRIFFVANDACGCWDRNAYHKKYGLYDGKNCENRRASYCDSTRLALRDEAIDRGAPASTPAWREFERVHAARNWQAWQDQSGIGVFDDGVSSRLLQGSIRGFGNAIKPQVAQAFIEAYMSC